MTDLPTPIDDAALGHTSADDALRLCLPIVRWDFTELLLSDLIGDGPWDPAQIGEKTLCFVASHVRAIRAAEEVVGRGEGVDDWTRAAIDDHVTWPEATS